MSSVSVTGGPGGIRADCDDMIATAAIVGHAAEQTLTDATALHATLLTGLDPGTTLLDPVGAARFEQALLAALDGPHGLTAIAMRCATTSAHLSAAAAAYSVADQLRTEYEPMLDAVGNLPSAVRAAVPDLVGGHPGQALTDLAAADPQVADVLVDAAAAVGLRAGTLGLLFQDGRARVESLGADAELDEAGPPRDLPGVLSGLSRRNGDAAGAVDVRILTAADGRRRAIVDIPGTKDWSARGRNPNVANLGSDLAAIAGRHTSYEAGVIDAIKQAGIGPDDEVMLVGHSLGGIVAVSAAATLARTGQARVTHVVTAGAPVATLLGRVPAQVHVLALENSADVVPHLDARSNPDLANVTTVRFGSPDQRADSKHDIERSYLIGARQVQRSEHASARAFTSELADFLDVDSVQTQRFLITRDFG